MLRYQRRWKRWNVSTIGILSGTIPINQKKLTAFGESQTRLAWLLLLAQPRMWVPTSSRNTRWTLMIILIASPSGLASGAEGPRMFLIKSKKVDNDCFKTLQRSIIPQLVQWWLQHLTLTSLINVELTWQKIYVWASEKLQFFPNILVSGWSWL